MLTNRQEAFAQAIVSGRQDNEAYIMAGYKTEGKTAKYISTKANELKRNPKVTARIIELREKVEAKRLETLTWTKDKAAAQLMWALVEARKGVEASAASAASLNSFLAVIRMLNDLEGIEAMTAASVDKVKTETARMKAQEDDDATLIKLDEVLDSIESSF